MRTHEDVGKFAGRITRGDARMVNAEDLSPALRGKSRAQQLRLIQSIIDAGRRDAFPSGRQKRRHWRNSLPDSSRVLLWTTPYCSR
jgi:hypothetical protein